LVHLDKAVEYIDKLADDGNSESISFGEGAWEFIKGLGDAADSLIGAQGAEMYGLFGAAGKLIMSSGKAAPVLGGAMKAYFGEEGIMLTSDGFAKIDEAEEKEDIREGGASVGMGLFMLKGTFNGMQIRPVSSSKAGGKQLSSQEARKYLGIADGQPLTPELLKQAYRSAVLKNHPDKGGNAEAFQKVQDAYEVLKKSIKETSGEAGDANISYDIKNSAGTKAPEDILKEWNDKINKLTNSRQLSAEAGKVLAQVALKDEELANTILTRISDFYSENAITAINQAAAIDREATIMLLNMTEKQTIINRVTGKIKNQNCKPIYIFYYYEVILDTVKMIKADSASTTDLLKYTTRSNSKVLSGAIKLAEVDKTLAINLFKENRFSSSVSYDLLAEALKTNRELTMELVKNDKKKYLDASDINNIVNANQKAPEFMTSQKELLNAGYKNFQKLKDYISVAKLINLLGADFAGKTIESLTLTQKHKLLNVLLSSIHSHRYTKYAVNLFPMFKEIQDNRAFVIKKLKSELNLKSKNTDVLKRREFDTKILNLMSCNTNDISLQSAIKEIYGSIGFNGNAEQSGKLLKNVLNNI